MRAPFPVIDAFAAGHLPASEGHAVWFEQSGRADGEPVVFLHGGPGSGCIAAHRRFFDPQRWHAVLFDQRGCGRSTPVGGVQHNTIAHLVEDMERLRAHLGIERWVVFGGSWGSTLALAYAQRYPERVRALVLRGIFLARRCEIDWFVHGLHRFLPEVGAHFIGLVPEDQRSDPLAWYHAAVFGSDAALAVRAARAWSSVESAAMLLTQPARGGSGEAPADEVILAKARVQLHYIANGGFLEEGQLLRDAGRLAGIPTWIAQGRLDTICPPHTAHELAAAMPHAHLRIIEGAGHSAFEPGIADALMAALETVR
ncbi:MAG: prolyl aminopeptidase [Rhodocyclaceae bacterium]|nr:prolyl aminopeptidase [Rhodocyclaceae bacterium]